MAAVKRKLNAGEASNPSQENKRVRGEKKTVAPKTSNASRLPERNGDSKKSGHASSKPSASSLLLKEQPAFPRGGGNILTPLERKQIQAQATRDALKEHTTSSDLFAASEALSDASDNEYGHQDEEDISEKPRTKKGKKRTTSKAETKEYTSSRVEGLTYKRIDTGSLILGQVVSLNSRDLTIALPNNLVGYVPLTGISSQFTEKIEALLRDDNADEEANDGEDEDDIDLSHYFQIGQYFRTAVTSTGEDTGGTGTKGKKRIELSLDPKLTNAGLTRDNITIGCTIQVSVVSVEDHGLVVDLGIGDGNTKGFMPIQEFGAFIDISKIRTGSVVLCIVTSIGSNGRTVKLSASEQKLSSTSKPYLLVNAPTIDSFLPGTAVEVLLSEVTESGLVGKVLGMLDVTADLVHSGIVTSPEQTEKSFKPGSKIKGRLVYTFPSSDSKKLGFSVLENVVRFQPQPHSFSGEGDVSISSVIPKTKVIRVEPSLGVYLELGPELPKGFAHISRLADNKVDSISPSMGPFKLESLHPARVLDFNPVDNLFILSLQEKVLKQRFLRVEDVKVGEVVKGKIEKLLMGPNGIKGLIIEISEGVSGLVPHFHMSDVVLLHPEKKFREGQTVTARVLSTDITKRQIRLTLKKTLVNSEQKPWKDYKEIEIGDSSPGTLVKVEAHGAVVQFYGHVKGYLPVSEMSEAYIKDATQHFRQGQVVTVNAVNVNADSRRLTLSCRDPSTSNSAVHFDIASLAPGTLVNGTVFEKSQDDLLLRLDPSNTIARLHLDHVSDGSLRKRQLALDKIRVGQVLKDLLILEVQPKRRMVNLSNRPILIKATQDGRLLRSFEDLKEDLTVTGIVSNITSDGVFVSFAGGLTGLMPNRQVPVEAEKEVDFGLFRLQPITAQILSIDYRGPIPRFTLTMRSQKIKEKSSTKVANGNIIETNAVIDPVDGVSGKVEEFVAGKITKARIVSVKETQINVELAKGIQGRIDVSEIFDQWDDIKDRKRPLRIFNPKQILPVRILGAHDTRNHRFLPITHRSGKSPVFELTAKASFVQDPSKEIVTLDKLTVGSSWLAFVNNIGDDCLWVNISPNVRGRIRAIDVADDLSRVSNIGQNFPIGSALRVRVLAVDVSKNHLDLTAKSGDSASQLTTTDISEGMILAGKITKVSERQLLVQLSDTIIGAVDLIDLTDDYSLADTTKYEKNDIVRVCVVRVDIPNKKINLSLRPSKVLSSSLAVEDPEITSVQQLKVNDVCRGFISNVADKGVFVTLGHGITAFVRVTNLSDSYLKDWKNHFQRDQLVKGKIISLDQSTGHVQLSLKESMLNADYVPPITITDLKVGDIVTGKVAKVEEFGVFIVVDKSANVRGLCHRSEIAEQRIEDASKLFTEGDAVKAKVLKIDLEKRRINFGLKASYFVDDAEDDSDSGDESEETGDEAASGGMLIDLESKEEEDQINQVNDGERNDEELENAHQDRESDSGASDEDEHDSTPQQKATSIAQALSVGGFDWAGGLDNGSLKHTLSTPDTDDEREMLPKKKKKRRAEIEIDRTGDLDANGPQSVDDFERLLLGEPDSALLWLQYMAFHIELGEVDEARQIGERALKTIGLGQDAEKLNIWIALLNVENTYGDEDSMEAIFKRACEFNDPQEIHARLTSIYIQSGKLEKADGLFQAMLKKFAQDPKIWINYATFLFDTVSEPEKARQLLPRALQTLPSFTHVDITSKFAQLEFRSSSGLPERGRTIFEGLLDSFPKRMDLWNVLLDLESKLGNKEQVRQLYERIFAGKIKNKQAKFFFKRWLAYEEQVGDERSIDQVKARAAEFVSRASKQDE